MAESKNQLQQILDDILQDKNTNLTPDNLKEGVTCLGVKGNLTKLKGQQKIINPTITEQTVTPDTGYNALTSITVNAVDNSIDSNIQPENIKKNVNILGITGTYEGSGGGSSDYNAKLVPINGKINAYITEISTQLDTSSVTDMAFMFNDCTNLTTIPLLDTSNVTDMYYMFYNCTNLTEIPLLDTSKVTNMYYMFASCTNLTTIPLLNTSNVINMNAMFNNCKNLTTIPLLDTSSVTNMNNMFKGCASLSDESLNNILAMGTNAVKITNSSYKTLKYIGLTSKQATKCTTLSNYQAFLDAGWTTGY